MLNVDSKCKVDVTVDTDKVVDMIEVVTVCVDVIVETSVDVVLDNTDDTGSILVDDVVDRSVLVIECTCNDVVVNSVQIILKYSIRFSSRKNINYLFFFENFKRVHLDFTSRHYGNAGKHVKIWN